MSNVKWDVKWSWPETTEPKPKMKMLCARDIHDICDVLVFSFAIFDFAVFNFDYVIFDFGYLILTMPW